MRWVCIDMGSQGADSARVCECYLLLVGLPPDHMRMAMRSRKKSACMRHGEGAYSVSANPKDAYRYNRRLHLRQGSTLTHHNEQPDAPPP